jgi:leucyl-tRNA synthetase
VGAEVEFAVEGSDDIITVFTTRPDTLFGASFVALAPENPLAKQLATSETRQKVEDYIATATSKSEVERQENKQKNRLNCYKARTFQKFL